MNKLLKLFVIFSVTYFLYLGIATKWTFVPKWTLDHFNPFAQSLRQFRFDIPNPTSTYDLMYYKGKWYAPWGPLAAFFLIPFQIIRGRYIPTVYLSILSASINAVMVYLLLERIRRDYFPKMRNWEVYVFLLFFLFGTTHVYVGTIGSSWHVDQMVTSVLGTLGIYFIVKKHRTTDDYRYSSIALSATLIGRPTYVMLLALPGLLYMWDQKTALWERKDRMGAFKSLFLIFGIPLLIFSLSFFMYNLSRFGNALEYGYRYIHEAPYLENRRKTQGTFSFTNFEYNIWYMIFETPKLTRDGPTHFDFNLKGNSIFFLSPPFLAIFLASPIIRRQKKFFIQPLIVALWLAAIMTILPSLIYYSTAWMQFGYRYTLDITVSFLILMVFDMRGKVNSLLLVGTIFSIWIYSMGITALQ